MVKAKMDLEPNVCIVTHMQYSRYLPLSPSSLLFLQKKIDVTQYVGIDANNSQLVYLNNSDVMDSDEFSLRMSLLSQHPVLNITRLLQDGHLYVFKRWVIDLISVVSQKRNMASIKEHVLPLLVKSQQQKVLADREGVTKGKKNIIPWCLSVFKTKTKTKNVDKLY